MVCVNVALSRNNCFKIERHFSCPKRQVRQVVIVYTKQFVSWVSISRAPNFYSLESALRDMGFKMT